jgi:hypothetical protein
MHEGWALISQIGLWGWIGSVVGFILNAFGDSGAFDRKAGYRWAGCVVVLFAMWVVGMLRA